MVMLMINFAFYALPVRATPNQKRSNILSEVCQKRQNGGRNSQKALRVPFPFQWGRFLRGGDGSFQVVGRTHLEVDLEQTQNYYVEYLALYLRRMII